MNSDSAELTNEEGETHVHVREDSATHVATITFRRGTNNYFDMDLLDRLVTAMEGLAHTGVRAIVLESSAKHFCAGMNFQPRNLEDDGGPHIYDDVVPRLFAQTLPLVAAINGATIGGGLGLVMAADFRVGTPRARFAANFARLGISQGFALSATLPSVIGAQRAAELLYTGRRVTGAEAFEIGLCDRLVEPDDVSREAHRLAADIASSAPLAVASIRRTLRERLNADVAVALAQERLEQGILRRTNDFREGVLANAERREPRFTAS
ncbi:enoyl-CoA hydratase/isomerase family protein [Arthrobacter sp. FW306-2-2C-D06B]|uniref:enoyl-CoA hydratase/isomerase family protein n=1 Tax=Arthrobacter sp. FW306-2-2C-D06B TaxID=2879618 RepID=UPI001F4866B5|nr:enoyl-CoA hydratase/isomerase family protein [Arthrobacter sp. FW306-2-2C-D06B]UKA60500.1 enoyl-CoA hydratase/isomerase family protein [Arthrobacter sp. FW306-2-2C-D06B]